MDPQQSQQHRLCSLYIEGLERESLRSQPYFARSCYATVLMIPWLAMPMLLEILYAWEEESSQATSDCSGNLVQEVVVDLTAGDGNEEPTSGRGSYRAGVIAHQPLRAAVPGFMPDAALNINQDALFRPGVIRNPPAASGAFSLFSILKVLNPWRHLRKLLNRVRQSIAKKM